VLGLSFAALLSLPGLAGAAVQNAYVANFGSGSVSQFGVGVGGALTPANPSTVSAGVSPWGIAVTPNATSAYVTNSQVIDLALGVSQYDVSPAGTLSAKSPPTATAGEIPQAIAVHPDGASAYVANFGSDSISQYDVAPVTGLLTPDTPATVATGQGPSGIAVSPNGESVYVTNDVDSQVSQYDVTPGDGTLTPMDPPTVAAESEPGAVAVSSDGLSAYVVNSGSNTITQYDVELDGALAPKEPATIGTGDAPVAITTSPDGDSAYVANFDSDSISQYTVAPDGTLAPKGIATIATGDGPSSIALSPDGESAYATNFNATTVSQYTVAADGTLSPAQPATVTAGDRPHAIALALADAPDPGATPQSLAFGGVDVGVTSAAQTVTLSNAADAPAGLDVGQIATTGTSAGDFSITTDGCSNLTVPPGDTCEVEVAFTPSSLGGKSAALSIPSNAVDSPLTVPLSGSGTDPDQSIAPASIPFGDQLTGTASSVRTVTLTNQPSASAPDVIGQAQILGADAGQFGIVTDACSGQTLAVGASCALTVRFAPTLVQVSEASLSIPSNDPTSPATVALSGTGTSPDESVSPSAIQFGEVPIRGQSSTQAVTVANRGSATAPLSVGSVALGGSDPGQFDIVFDGCSNQEIAVGQQCQLGVRMAPSVAGPASATVQIASNGSSAPVGVALAGTATPPSNQFTIGKAKRNARKGTAALTLSVPGPGVAQVAGKGVRGGSAESAHGGNVTLIVKPTGATKRKLDAKGADRVLLRLTYTPSGGSPAAQTQKLKLIERR
jgi:6-phosphogluconolactonase (cycloisomerase 2 family)